MFKFLDLFLTSFFYIIVVLVCVRSGAKVYTCYCKYHLILHFLIPSFLFVGLCTGGIFYGSLCTANDGSDESLLHRK